MQNGAGMKSRSSRILQDPQVEEGELASPGQRGVAAPSGGVKESQF